MRNLHFLILWAAILLVANSCTDDPDGEGTLVDLDPAEQQLLQPAYLLPEQSYSFGAVSSSGAASLLYQASLINGALVTTGTLRETGQGLQYMPQPNDQFVYQDNNGEVIGRFWYQRVEGDLTGDDQNFLNSDHLFEFRVEAPGQGDMQFVSAKTGTRRALTMEGTIIYEGAEYQVDLVVDGTYFFTVDNFGSELDIDAQYTGTIRGQGLQENVNERWQYESVLATGQGGFFAENAIRTFNTSWSIGDNEFRYQDGGIQSVFRDGRPTEWDVNNSPWSAQGTLLLNGRPLGQLVMGEEGGSIKVWLQLNDQRVEMTSWRR